MTTDAPKTLTVRLEEPITHGGKTYSELTFRRLKAGDLLVTDKVKGELMKTFAMFASMAGVSVPVLEEMSIEDFQRVSLEVAPLMGKSAKRAMDEALSQPSETEASLE